MNSLWKLTLGLASVLTLAAPVAAEDMLAGKIGFGWPQALMASAPSGNAELAFGKIIDKKVAYGVAVDFLWNVNSKIDTAAGHYRTISEQQAYMFPVMFFVQVDPLPDLIVHPVAHFNIGYNSMIYSYSAVDSATGGSTPLHPYFNGLIIKTGIDGLYDLGSNSSLFLGLEYQWAGTSTSSNTQGLFDKKDMSGLSLSAGFRVIL